MSFLDRDRVADIRRHAARMDFVSGGGVPWVDTALALCDELLLAWDDVDALALSGAALRRRHTNECPVNAVCTCHAAIPPCPGEPNCTCGWKL